MTDEFGRKIIAIIAEQAMLDPSEIALDAAPADLGIDSLGLVEIVFAIEETFDISVPFNANEPHKSDFDVSTIAKIIEAVRSLVDKRG